MREKLEPKVDDLSENGYDFHFGDYISEAFSIFGKYVGGFMGFTFIYFAMTSMANMVPIVGPFANTVLAAVLLAGLFIVSHKINTEQPFEFGDFFAGFQRFGDIAIPALLCLLIYIAAMLPFIFALAFSWWGVFADGGLEDFILSDNPFESFPFWTFLLIIPIVYLAIAYIYTTLFVVFYDAKPWEAMEASRKIVTRNWFIIFAYSIVIGIIASLGIIAFLIGIFATMPIAMIAIYTSFADITGLVEDETAEEDLIDHLVV